MSKLDFLNEKEWYKSKTIWVQMITMILGVSLIIAEDYAMGGALTTAGVLNTILRFLTEEKVTLK